MRILFLKPIENEKNSFVIDLIVMAAMLVAVFLILFNSLLLPSNTFGWIIGLYISALPLFLFVTFFLENRKMDIYTIFIIVVLAYQSLTGLFGIFSGENPNAFSNASQLVSSLSLEVILYVCRSHSFRNGTLNVLLWGNIALSILFIIIYFTDLAYVYGDSYLSWLTLNMGNSNETAIMLLGNLCVLTLTFFYFESASEKLFVSALALVVFIMLFETNSRLGLALAVLFLFAVLFNFKVRNWHIIICLVLPFLFYIIYNIADQIVIFQSLTFLDKPVFSGRVELWRVLFNEFYDGIGTLLFGNYKDFQLENSHNGFLSVLFNYGLLGILLYYISLFVFIFELNDGNDSRRAKVAMYTVLTFLLISFTESAVVITGRNFCVFYMVAAVALKNEKDKRKPKPFYKQFNMLDKRCFLSDLGIKFV